MGIRVQFQRGDQPVSDAPAFPRSVTADLAANFFLEGIAADHSPLLQQNRSPIPTPY
jgi:hypothetical protein